MNAPLASLYDISLGIHQLTGLALILVAVAITILSIMSRSQEGMLEKALPLATLSGPLFGLVLFTGAYQMFDLNIKFFQVWVIGALLLGIGFIGTLHGTWRPRAERLVNGEVTGEEAEKERGVLVAVATSLIVMVIIATYLMEAQPV